jgi:hypothetical protein
MCRHLSPLPVTQTHAVLTAEPVLPRHRRALLSGSENEVKQSVLCKVRTGDFPFWRHIWSTTHVVTTALLSAETPTQINTFGAKHGGIVFPLTTLLASYRSDHSGRGVSTRKCLPPPVETLGTWIRIPLAATFHRGDNLSVLYRIRKLKEAKNQ